MKKQSLLFLLTSLLAFPAISFSQTRGISFINENSWKKIQIKAKRENKYIFVDSYATWCGPCRAMDSTVFKNDSVGDIINPNFISVRIQMDTTKGDDSSIKSWYKDASMLKRDYQIDAFPTFLFFSPSGRIVHKGIAYHTPANFVNLAKDALDTTRQYYTLLQKYQDGSIETTSLPALAEQLELFKNSKLAYKLMNEYFKNHLLLQTDTILYKKSNISLLAQYTRSSKDPGFSLFYNEAKRVDTIMSDSTYAASVIHYIIYMEEISPSISALMRSGATDTNWDSLKLTIENKYDPYYAERTITDARSKWYAYKKNWSEHTKYLVLFSEKFRSSLTTGDLNDNAWNVFIHSSDKKEIEKAIEWMEHVIKTDNDTSNVLPNSWDTYANLLYKIGEREKAIAAEEQALSIVYTYKLTWKRKQFERTLDKMKKGEPTWIFK